MRGLGLTVQWSIDAGGRRGSADPAARIVAPVSFVPGIATECLIAEVVFVLVLSIVFVNIVVLAQYRAVALKFPYADPWLAAAAARLGIHVPALARWTNQHPAIARVLSVAYLSHMPQFALAASASALFESARRCGNSPFIFRCAWRHHSSR